MWSMTWADDHMLDTSWGDSGGFGGTNRKGRVSMGSARVHGSGDDWHGENVWGGANPESDDIPYAIQNGIDILLDRTFFIRAFDFRNTNLPL